MVEGVVKYFALLFCCFYAYTKALNLKAPTHTWILYPIFSLAISCTAYIVRLYVAPLSIIIMAVAFAGSVYLLHKTSISLLITASACAFGLAYMAFLLAAVAMTTIVQIVESFANGKCFPDMISRICVAAIQFLLVTLPFKFRRYKNGIPLLKEHGADDVGIYISTAILLAVSFSGAKQETDLIFIIPMVFVLISGVLLLLWWRNRTTRSYIEKTKARELKTLEEQLQVHEVTVQNLQRQNEELSKIIHRDNKLIPAMEHAMRDYLQTIGQVQDAGERDAKGKELAEELARISQDRKGILHSYESHNKKLTSTGLTSIDSLLNYMLQRAQAHQIEFDVSLSGSVKFMVESLIKEQDLQTFLSDLIENAIIATKASDQKQVLLHIGLKNQQYSVDVFDTGAPFRVETLIDMGIKRTTTHLDDGGSGIGMMSTFEIARNSNASLVIDECLCSDLFTKCVSVCFDGRREYRLKTNCPDQIVPFINRPDLILVIGS